MTPAEKRIKDLVDRWLTSLDLHLQYAELNDLAYNRVQNWPVHDRPAKPILEIAQKKARELSVILRARQAAGDAKFAEAVELINFLTNLVGSQYVQRFIPIAEAPQQAATPRAVAPAPTPAARPAQASPAASDSATRTPPKPANLPTAPASPPQVAAVSRAVSNVEPPKPATTGSVTRGVSVPELDNSLILAARAVNANATTRIQPSAPPPRASSASRVDNDATREMPRAQKNPIANKKPLPAKPTPPKIAVNNKLDSKPGSSKAGGIEQFIIDDAVRLINWGRQWHELAEAIARIADRPSTAEIRKILRNHRDEIQRRAAEPQA